MNHCLVTFAEQVRGHKRSNESRRQQHYGMSIVATVVHRAVMGRAMRKLVLLQNRQRIHVGALPYRAGFVTCA